MRDTNIQVGDTVVVAVRRNQKYRPDLIAVTVLGVRVGAKLTHYDLSDNTSVNSIDKLWKIHGEHLDD